MSDRVSPITLTLDTTLRELLRRMAQSQLDLVACDLLEMRIPGVVMVAIMPQSLADQVRPVLTRQFETYYAAEESKQ